MTTIANFEKSATPGNQDLAGRVCVVTGAGSGIGRGIAVVLAQAAAAERSASAFGPCDVLVNNAGMLRPGPLDSLTLEEWNKVLSVNLTGYFLCAQAFGRHDQPGTTERRSQAVPVGRIGLPADIAQAVLFLASDRAAYISGQELTVDGGFTRMLMGLIPRAGCER